MEDFYKNSEKRLLEQQERIKSLENELKVYAAYLSLIHIFISLTEFVFAQLYIFMVEYLIHIHIKNLICLLYTSRFGHLPI